MSFTVPDAEKRIAEKAAESFDDLSSRLKLAMSHLDIMYVPFKKYQEYDAQELQDNRIVLRRYRDQVQANFNDILNRAGNCLSLMGEFGSDTQTADLMNSFQAHVADIRKQVNRFLGLFSNIGSAEFMTAALAGIELIKKEASQLKQLINDRILTHIDTNILAKHWTSNLDNKYQNKVYEKLPMIIQLFQERQKAMNTGAQES
jgi:hypothetical protein